MRLQHLLSDPLQLFGIQFFFCFITGIPEMEGKCKRHVQAESRVTGVRDERRHRTSCDLDLGVPRRHRLPSGGGRCADYVSRWGREVGGKI